jgi:hypothetical protein
LVESKRTSSRPPVAFDDSRRSASIQRRAAPIPLVSDCVSESVLRVWNETSLSMRARMRSSETCFRRSGIGSTPDGARA